jgi:hypothetical protein
VLRSEGLKFLPEIVIIESGTNSDGVIPVISAGSNTNISPEKVSEPAT